MIIDLRKQLCRIIDFSMVIWRNIFNRIMTETKTRRFVLFVCGFHRNLLVSFASTLIFTSIGLLSFVLCNDRSMVRSLVARTKVLRVRFVVYIYSRNTCSVVFSAYFWIDVCPRTPPQFGFSDSEILAGYQLDITLKRLTIVNH